MRPKKISLCSTFLSSSHRRRSISNSSNSSFSSCDSCLLTFPTRRSKLAQKCGPASNASTSASETCWSLHFLPLQAELNCVALNTFWVLLDAWLGLFTVLFSLGCLNGTDSYFDEGGAFNEDLAAAADLEATLFFVAASSTPGAGLTICVAYWVGGNT